VSAESLMAKGLESRRFAPVSTQFTSDGREWVEVWLESRPPAACRVTFEVDGIERPVIVTHTWAEYTQGKASPTQLKMPATMLAKSTRSLGVRQISPSTTSGLLSEEEAHAVENAADAEIERAEQAVEAVTPEVDKESAGTKMSRGEQHATRLAEMVDIGKSLRADLGAETAEMFAGAIKAQGHDLSDPKQIKLSAANIKSLRDVAKRAREDAERSAQPDEPAPSSTPEARSAELDAAAESAAQSDEPGVRAVAETFDAEFVI
jgi:hypothetical protein